MAAVPGKRGGPRILLAPMGTLGDVLPFVAVALALRRLGCTPVVATMEQYRSCVEAEGIAFRAIRPGRVELEADGLDDAAVAQAVGRDQRAAFAFAAPYLEVTLADLTDAAAGCDAVVGGSLSAVARLVAEAAGLPLVTLILQPMGFLSCTDPPVFGEAPWLAAIGRRCGPAAMAALYRVASLRGSTALRPLIQLRARMGLPRLRDELRDGPRGGAGIVALYPTAFAALPDDAPARVISAGFPFYSGPAAPLPERLTAFLDTGAPPLVFTLGSFVTHAAGDFYAEGAALAHRLGRRAILLVGGHGVERHRALESADILVAAQAPHDALFPRAAGVIHHGGIGTIAQALRTAAPQLVCPFFGDQFDNAARLERLGVGTTLPLRQFAAARAATPFAAMLASPAIARRVRNLADRVACDGGPAVAAAEIARLVFSVRSSAAIARRSPGVPARGRR